jgi:hypothetical protein
MYFLSLHQSNSFQNCKVRLFRLENLLKEKLESGPAVELHRDLVGGPQRRYQDLHLASRQHGQVAGQTVAFQSNEFYL